MRISVISGGFDPLHKGHISLIQAARAYGDCLIAILNSDDWLTRKKGKPFMDYENRAAVLLALSSVDFVIPAQDSDGSVAETLRDIKMRFPGAQITFCNGGDRFANNTPEAQVRGVSFAFGVGGGKVASSSDFLRVHRSWGNYEVLLAGPGYVVKRLNVDGEMSVQRHFQREEVWQVVSGHAHILEENRWHTARPGDVFRFPRRCWHSIHGHAKVIEIQYGEPDEDDIERRQR